jgi:hypothetical protein
VALLEDFLRSRLSETPDPMAAEVTAIVERIAAEPALLRVDERATSPGRSEPRPPSTLGTADRSGDHRRGGLT